MALFSVGLDLNLLSGIARSGALEEITQEVVGVPDDSLEEVAEEGALSSVLVKSISWSLDRLVKSVNLFRVQGCRQT